MHIGDLELGVLELGDAATELDTLMGVLDDLFHGAFAQAQGLRGNTDAAAVQGSHGDIEALALLAQQTVCGDAAVLHDQLTGGRTADAHLLFVLADREAGVGALHDESGDLLAGLFGIPLIGDDAGNGDDDKYIGKAGVGDEDLGAVEHPVIAIQHGNGLLALRVGAGTRLGEAERADPFAAAQLGQVIFLLLLGAVFIDGSTAQGGVGGKDNAGGAADLGKLFDRHDIGEDVAAGAAVLFGEIDSHHAQLSHLLDGLFGEALFLIHLSSQGLYFILGKLTVHFLHHGLLFGELEIHNRSSLLLTFCNRRSQRRSFCPACRRGPFYAAGDGDDICRRRFRPAGPP